MSIYDKSSLVLIPSGTKTGKVYSQKPVSGDGDFTFTRSSAATRVNADGNIEKETQNLLLQSNQFDVSANWVNTFSSETSGHSGYDGSSDAWLLTKTDAGGRIHQNFTASGVLTYSVYLKANASDYALIQLNGSGADKYMYVDLTDGSKGSIGGGNIDENIVDVGGGWYRCSITANTDATRVRIYPANSTGDVSATSGSIYIQDAQLEYGLVARDVITTTTTAVEGGITDNVPRLDYTDSSCPALLLEPQRTNLMHYSAPAPLTTTTSVTDKWVIYSATTGVVNDAIGVDGYKTATKYTNASNTVNDYMLYRFLNVTSGQTYTCSGYLKLGTATNACIVLNNGSAWNAIPNANFVATAAAGYDEWKRFEITFTAPATNKINVHIGYHNETGVDAQSLGNFYLDSFQCEAGSYATSYIPTYGSSVTRVADNNVRIGSQPDLIGQTEGTLFFEGTAEAGTEIIALHRSTLGGIFILSNSSSKVQFFAWYGNGVVINYSSTIDSTSNFKAAFAYKDGDTALYCNGQQISLRTEAFDPQITLQDVWLNQGGYAASKNKLNAKQALVFKTRLSNEELAALTTI